MDRSPSWEAKSSLANQDVLWNPKVHYRIHKRPLPVPILSQSNPVRASPFHSLNIQFNTILPSALRSSKWYVFIRSLHEKPSRHFFCPTFRKKRWAIKSFLLLNPCPTTLTTINATSHTLDQQTCTLLDRKFPSPNTPTKAINKIIY